ncbi:MAG: T9SS type A sorting domain-containing protein, partial [Candidatus Stygibacter frigidus]|nr:T9SS type A sorting domain-containing protein [Candidatus Stygibacter frigidus]
AAADGEWVSDVWLDFPLGVTVLDASDVVGGSGGKMIWDGTTGSGQRVNWHGVTPYEWGVLHDGQIGTWEVDVLLSTEFAGDMTFGWEIGGDGYGADPHNVTGDIYMQYPLRWINLDTSSGNLEDGEDMEITMNFDTNDIEEGIHTCDIVITCDSWDTKIITVVINVTSIDLLELGYDDGSAEAGVNVGVAQNMAVKFDPDYTNGSCVLTNVRFFIESLNTGQYMTRIYDDSGAGGMPGAQLAQFVIVPDNLTTGWNTVAVPEASLEAVTFDSGAYYVSIFEMENASTLGKDTDSVEGQSYITVSNIWEVVTDGNLMIRSYLYYPEELGTIGDVDSNGEIEAYDASMVLQYTVGIPTPVDPFPENLADVDGNGSVEAYDAALILQYVVGIIDEFPITSRINDIPSVNLDYYYDGEELVITANGELYSASLEFPFKLEAEKLQINDQFISAVWGDKVAIASAYPVSGEILRIPVGHLEGQHIFTSANSIRGELMISKPVLASGIRSVYPNPFNPETTIGYNMGIEGTVKIDIYNCKGQKVETLLEARQDAGEHSVVWSAEKRASGIYFVRVNINGQREQRKVLLIK